MSKWCLLVFLSVLIMSNRVLADDKLILDFDSENDLLSLSHNIDNFMFAPTRNYAGASEENINNMSVPALKGHLAVTGLLRLNGEVVGFATEQEIVYTDAGTKRPMAESMWMIRLHHPGLTGFLTVLQQEDASRIFTLVQEVMSNQDRQWDDKWRMYQSTSGRFRVQFASGDLAKYQGGIFEEYNGLNPADFARLGRFRAKIQFVIYPGK